MVQQGKNAVFNQDVHLGVIVENFTLNTRSYNDPNISNLQRCLIEFAIENPDLKKKITKKSPTSGIITLLEEYSNR